jgi:hypothetical protein
MVSAGTIPLIWTDGQVADQERAGEIDFGHHESYRWRLVRPGLFRFPGAHGDAGRRLRGRRPVGTKLHVPRPRPGFVPGPRLLERLTEATAHALTLVCAPAGFGETSLLAEWARSRPAAVGGACAGAPPRRRTPRRPRHVLAHDGGRRSRGRWPPPTPGSADTTSPTPGAPQRRGGGRDPTTRGGRGSGSRRRRIPGGLIGAGRSCGR